MTQIGRILLMVTLLGLLALTPTRTSAATIVPFRASVFEHFTLRMCAPQTVCITAVGVGHAAHLGKVTEYATGCSHSATSTARDSYVVTGGTGRFGGASGSGTDINVYRVTAPGKGVATTKFRGNLSFPGSLA